MRQALDAHNANDCWVIHANQGVRVLQGDLLARDGIRFRKEFYRERAAVSISSQPHIG